MLLLRRARSLATSEAGLRSALVHLALSSRLSLDLGQREQLAELLRQQEPKYAEAMSGCRAPLEQTRTELRSALEPLLSQEQRRELDALVNRLRIAEPPPQQPSGH